MNLNILLVTVLLPALSYFGKFSMLAEGIDDCVDHGSKVFNFTYIDNSYNEISQTNWVFSATNSSCELYLMGKNYDKQPVVSSLSHLSRLYEIDLELASCGSNSSWIVLENISMADVGHYRVSVYEQGIEYFPSVGIDISDLLYIYHSSYIESRILGDGEIFFDCNSYKLEQISEIRQDPVFSQQDVFVLTINLIGAACVPRQTVSVKIHNTLEEWIESNDTPIWSYKVDPTNLTAIYIDIEYTAYNKSYFIYSSTVPEVDNVEPNFGPIAGGTEVTIRGRYFSYVQEISIADQIIEITSRNYSVIVLETPGVNKTGVHDIVLTTLYGNLTEVFEYKPNPVIDYIYPLKSLVTGGTRMYINGSYLDSVAKPELVIIMINSTLDSDGNWSVQNETFQSPCINITEPLLTCKTPIILDGLFDPNTNASKLEFMAQAKLDRVDTSANREMVEMGSPPEITECEEPPLEYKKDSLIHIKGENFLQGASGEDFNITIGEASSCKIVDVTNELLRCMPPSKPPAEHDDNGHYEIHVKIGNHKASFCDFVYPDNQQMHYIIIGTFCGIFVITLLVKLIVVLRQSAQCTKQSKETEVPDFINLPPVVPDLNEKINLPPVQPDLYETK